MTSSALAVPVSQSPPWFGEPSAAGQLYREGRGDASAMEEVEVSRQWQELFNVALRYGASNIRL